jgi:hypothetical protein
MEAKLDNVLRVLEILAGRIDNFERKHEACSAESIDKKIAEKVEEYVDEIMEREKRKLNIIVANLPESEKETVEDRKTEDRDRVRQLVRKIVDETEAQEVDNPVRLGQLQIGRNTKPRLLRMTLKNEETKKKIMRNVASLNKNVPPKDRVYINDDSTPKEREKIRKLVTELKTRTGNGEQNLMINYREGKVVTRPQKQAQDQRPAKNPEAGAPNPAAAQAAAGKGAEGNNEH